MHSQDILHIFIRNLTLGQSEQQKIDALERILAELLEDPASECIQGLKSYTDRLLLNRKYGLGVTELTHTVIDLAGKISRTKMNMD